MPQSNRTGTQSVAAPDTDHGTVPTQPGPRFESAVPERPGPEDTALAEPESEPTEAPAPAQPAKVSSRNQHRFGPRDLLDPVVRQAKRVKGNLHRKRSSE
jgi:hypothetical protein